METVDLKQEFRELLKASKWSQAEAARQLAITPGALSQIVRENSPVKPSQGTLRLFKLLVLGNQPDAPIPDSETQARWPGAEAWEMDLILSMRKLSPETRDSLLQAFNTCIQANLPRERTSKKRPAR